ncbi:MAG: hypothetical protein LBE75_09455 [Burkholderiales bacterium]|nr:hypothetical protein [Burkholderiales bacterium]
MATMVRLQTVIIIVLSVVVLALAVILFFVYERPVAPTASPSAKTSAPLPPIAARPPAPPSPELDRYLNAPKDAVAIRAGQQAQRDKMERLKNLQTRFKEISAGGKTPDIEELDKLLSELVEIQGTSVIAGVDLNVLRQNLRVAQEVQALAKEMEAESKKPNPNSNRILEITKEIQVMQGKLRTDIMVGGGTTPIPPPSPAAPAQKDRKGP